MGDVRGRGLMVGVEFTDEKGEPDAATASAVVKHVLENRLLLLICGSLSKCGALDSAAHCHERAD